MLIEKALKASLNAPCFSGEECWSLCTLCINALLPTLSFTS